MRAERFGNYWWRGLSTTSKVHTSQQDANANSSERSIYIPWTLKSKKQKKEGEEYRYRREGEGERTRSFHLSGVVKGDGGSARRTSEKSSGRQFPKRNSLIG